MIIGATGRLTCGKDSFVKILQKNYSNVERIAFADKLKEFACALFNISRETIEELKNNDNAIITYPNKYISNVDSKLQFELGQITMRQFLQRVGSEAFRDVFSKTFWIDEAMKIIDNNKDSSKIFVVTDARFINEIESIKSRGGIIIKIRRTQSELIPISHVSEQNLSEYANCEIENNSTLDDFELNIEKFVKWFNNQNFKTKFIRIAN